MAGFFSSDKDVTATDLRETRFSYLKAGENEARLVRPQLHGVEHGELMLRFPKI